jgi:hypothetical protein
MRKRGYRATGAQVKENLTANFDCSGSDKCAGVQ